MRDMKRKERLSGGLRKLLLRVLALPLLATLGLAVALTLRGGQPQREGPRSTQPIRTFAPVGTDADEPTALSGVFPRASAAAPTGTPVPERAALSRGDQGEEVARLQRRLDDLGYPVGEPDGVYDEETVACLAAFQGLCALPQTGDADARTLERLYAPDAPSAEPPGEPKNPDLAAQAVAPSAASEEESPYVGNANSKRFHRADCGSVQEMSEKNKIPLSSREEAIDRGFIPCKRCNP